ncbi:hypothetical protein AB0B07_03430 [Streptomyces sioyaensis]
MMRSAVELGHQLTVRGAGGFEVFVPFRKLAAEVENLLVSYSPKKLGFF